MGSLWYRMTEFGVAAPLTVNANVDLPGLAASAVNVPTSVIPGVCPLTKDLILVASSGQIAYAIRQKFANDIKWTGSVVAVETDRVVGIEYVRRVRLRRKYPGQTAVWSRSSNRAPPVWLGLFGSTTLTAGSTA